MQSKSTQLNKIVKFPSDFVLESNIQQYTVKVTKY